MISGFLQYKSESEDHEKAVVQLHGCSWTIYLEMQYCFLVQVQQKDLKTVSKTCLFQHAGKTMSFTQEETDVTPVRSEQQAVQDGTLGCIFVVK